MFVSLLISHLPKGQLILKHMQEIKKKKKKASVDSFQTAGRKASENHSFRTATQLCACAVFIALPVTIYPWYSLPHKITILYVLVNLECLHKMPIKSLLFLNKDHKACRENVALCVYWSHRRIWHPNMHCRQSLKILLQDI